MLRFLVGLVVGFLAAWLLGGQSKAGSDLSKRREEMGEVARRAMRQTVTETTTAY